MGTDSVIDKSFLHYQPPLNNNAWILLGGTVNVKKDAQSHQIVPKKKEECMGIPLYSVLNFKGSNSDVTSLLWQAYPQAPAWPCD